ncbi:hypothetical protein DV737_g5601, partial [Chaetothyriales sp. CBS 132003]
MSTTARLRSLDIDNINPHVKEAKYAVRGELAIKSEEYRALLKKAAAQSHHGDAPPTPPDHPLPFDKVISANIGNPQQLDQKPITFFRQVLAICENPDLLTNEQALIDHFKYKQDAIDRARWLLTEVGSVGAYSQSAGAPAIRQSVANFIERRDGFPADFKDIYLSAGASSGVNTLLHLIAAKPETGVLVPIPQYPLYTATLSLLNARCVPYYLDEAKAWGTDLSVIQDAYNKAVADGTDVRAVVVINPGNPTGASLAEEDVRAVIKFAAERHLVIMADEVYQTNVFIGQFHSFKRVLRQLQKDEPGKYDAVELASLNSVSKGMVGECGHRGGYFELVGFDGQVQQEIFKFISIMLCPPVIGQCLVELMVNPPKPGDPSFELYDHEYNAIRNGLKERAYALYEAFKQMEGVKIGEPQGSMYLFPTITLPPKAIQAAKDAGKSPDDFYCLALLDRTGICVVPGSGFGQQEATRVHVSANPCWPDIRDWANFVRHHTLTYKIIKLPQLPKNKETENDRSEKAAEIKRFASRCPTSPMRSLTPANFANTKAAASFHSSAPRRELSAEQQSIVKSTAPVLAEHGLAITSHFYKRMLGNHPELRNIFNAAHQGTGAQPAALAHAVWAYAANIDNLGALTTAVARIGHKHASLGVRPDQYPIVGQNLLASIKEVLGDAATQPIIDAWAAAYQQLADIFINFERDLYAQAEATPGGWIGWRKFRVARQYVSIRVFVPELDVYQPRQYSLSDTGTGNHFRISVKREAAKGQERPAGRISNLLHEDISEGAELEVSTPYGEFTLDLESDAPVVLMSGGVGITPMLSMLGTLIERAPQRPVVFVHAARGGNVHAMKDYLSHVVEGNKQVSRLVFYEEVAASEQQGRDYDYQGRIELDKIKDKVLLPDANYYLCGPIPFMSVQQKSLEALGVPPERIHSEVFGSGVA